MATPWAATASPSAAGPAFGVTPVPLGVLPSQHLPVQGFRVQHQFLDTSQHAPVNLYSVPQLR